MQYGEPTAQAQPLAVQWDTRDVVKATATAVAVVFTLGIILAIIVSRAGDEDGEAGRYFHGKP